MITTNGLAQSCRYSYPTNMKNYCGPKNAHLDFAGFARRPAWEKTGEIMAQIRGFPILFSYYEFLAREFGLEEFDEQTISHYWGTGELGKVSAEKARRFVLEALTKKGLDVKRAKKISGEINGDVFLDHAFHVLRIRFVTDKVEKTIENFSNCLALPAQVIECTPETITAVDCRLDGLNGKFMRKKTLLENPFGITAEKGELVSVHWRCAIEKISSAQAEGLEKRVLEHLE
ncbi:MAG: hypothetical protein HY392_03880 [Candidatus Diapherotrites archaeon]|nr:hypothetical protein [Candidatus Diapherotrites archaeon]